MIQIKDEEVNETVGGDFSVDHLQFARDQTLQVILAAAKQIRAGMSESEARRLVQEVQTAHGARKSWHPAQIRFGKSTLLGFGHKTGEDVILQEDDIFFLDIGPIFRGHEGDVGRPFVIGHDPEMHRCCKDAGWIWQKVREHWREQQTTGMQLYQFAKNTATERGWILTLDKANGHRISDFPHAVNRRGSIEGFQQVPAANRWILEIQIRHPTRSFGAFYEDLLN